MPGLDGPVVQMRLARGHSPAGMERIVQAQHLLQVHVESLVSHVLTQVRRDPLVRGKEVNDHPDRKRDRAEVPAGPVA